MKDFNAQQARQIVDSVSTDELHNILVSIKFESINGKNVLLICKPIKEKTINALKDKGFKVKDESYNNIHRGDLYYSIYW